MSGNVTVLRPKERVRLDAAPIAAIYRNLGPSGAEQVVSRALGEVALALATLAEQVRNHDFADLDRQLRRLQRMSEHLGMMSLGAICADLRGCSVAGDPTAFGAVWARLLRVAERSLATDKDMRGQTV